MRYIVVFLLVYSNTLSSQVEFAPIGTVWNYEYITFQAHPPSFTKYSRYEIKVIKDTLIGLHMYRVLSRENPKNNNPSPYFESKQFIRQENGKIYNLFDKEYLLYDFDAKLNDTIRLFGFPYNGSGFPINELRSILFRIEKLSYDTIQSEIYKVQYVSSTCGLDNLILHQKYGCISPYKDLFFPEFSCMTDRQWWTNLRCYFEKEKLIYNFDSIPCDSIRPGFDQTSTLDPYLNIISVYQNQNNIIIKDETGLAIQNIFLYDINGKIIYRITNNNMVFHVHIPIENFNAGIYFISLVTSNGLRITKKIFL